MSGAQPRCAAQVKWHLSIALPVPGHRGSEEEGIAVLQAFHEVALDEIAHAAQQRSKKLTKVRKRRKGSVSDQAQPARGCPKFSNVEVRCAPVPTVGWLVTCLHGQAVEDCTLPSQCLCQCRASRQPVTLILMCKVMQRGGRRVCGPVPCLLHN